MRRLAADHALAAPQCNAKMFDVLIPIPVGSHIGAEPEVETPGAGFPAFNKFDAAAPQGDGEEGGGDEQV